MNAVPLPERIKDARDVLGWTREILAAYSGVSVSTIGRIERGEMQPRTGTVIALALALGIPPAELITEAGGTPPARGGDERQKRPT